LKVPLRTARGCVIAAAKPWSWHSLRGFAEHSYAARVRSTYERPVFRPVETGRYGKCKAFVFDANAQSSRARGLNRIAYAGMRIAEKIVPQQVAGYPVRQLTALRAADLVLPTGGDIFTSDYNNLRKHLSRSSRWSAARRRLSPIRSSVQEGRRSVLQAIGQERIHDFGSREFDVRLPAEPESRHPGSQDRRSGLRLTPLPRGMQGIAEVPLRLDPDATNFVALSVSEA